MAKSVEMCPLIGSVLEQDCTVMPFCTFWSCSGFRQVHFKPLENIKQAEQVWQKRQVNNHCNKKSTKYIKCWTE